MTIKNENVDTLKIVNVPIVKAPDHKVLYVNASRMGISAWDIRITLGQVIEGENGAQLNQDQITVVMTPAHAKVFLQNMEKTIGKYEETFGEIKDPFAAVAKEKQPKNTKAAKKA